MTQTLLLGALPVFLPIEERAALPESAAGAFKDVKTSVEEVVSIHTHRVVVR